MIINFDFITNSSSTVQIVFLPRDFRVELGKGDFYDDIETDLTQEDIDRLNIFLNDYRRNGGEMYADNGGDEKTLTYYVREYIPPEYVLGSCETGGDGNNSVFVISIEKVKAILEKELEGEINYEKKESKISTKKKR